jgi:hypothetical protein
MIFLAALLGASPDVDGGSPSFSRQDLRKLLDAVLTTPWEHVEGGLASYRCVKESAYEGSRLQVDVEVESGVAERERPLRPGKTIGPYQQYRPAKREGSVIFVSVTFTTISPAEVRFSAGLTGVEYDQHGKAKDGTIGIGCGASHEGRLMKSKGRWRKAGAR